MSIKVKTNDSNPKQFFAESKESDGYESTLGLSSLLPKRDFKMIQKDKKFYLLKVLNKGTHRAQQLLLCKFKDCGKKFSRKCGLKDHLMIHDNIKPFGCEYCDKHFTQLGNKDVHQRTCAKRVD